MDFDFRPAYIGTPAKFCIICSTNAIESWGTSGKPTLSISSTSGEVCVVAMGALIGGSIGVSEIASPVCPEGFDTGWPAERTCKAWGGSGTGVTLPGSLGKGTGVSTAALLDTCDG
ncbi:hypothetical protein ACHAP1_004436 [Verticillium nonalfalfae]